MACRDQSVTYLKSFGYNVIRLPKANIAPLQVLFDNGKNFDSLGKLSSVMTTGTNIQIPTVTENIVTSNISGKRTEDLTLDIGIDILGNIIGAMGGSKLGLKDQFSNAKTLTFEFENVLADSIEVIALDQYLTDADINSFSTQLKNWLEDGKIYVITEVIKSNKINVEATKNDKNSLNVDVPVIEKIVGGNVKVENSSNSDSKIAFTGSVPLVFGFKAVKLTFSMGQYTALKPLDVGRAASTDAKQEEDWLIPHHDDLVEID